MKKIILDLFTGTFTSLQRGEHVRLSVLLINSSFYIFIVKLKLNLTIMFCCFQSKSANVLAVLGAVASEALDLTGFYYSGKPSIIKRTNMSNRTRTGRYAFELNY